MARARYDRPHDRGAPKRPMDRIAGQITGWIMTIADRVSGSPPAAAARTAASGLVRDGGLIAGGRPARIAARSVSWAGAMADLYRSRLARFAVLVHHPQLRLQRRRRDLHFHLRLYRGVRLRPLDAAIRLCHRGGAGAAPGLADLCHAHPAVHRAGGGGLLYRRGARQAVLRQGNGDHRFPQSAGACHGPGAAVALSPAQHGRAAALHRADGVPAADPGADQMAAQSDAGDVGRALRAVLAL